MASITHWRAVFAVWWTYHAVLQQPISYHALKGPSVPHMYQAHQYSLPLYPLGCGEQKDPPHLLPYHWYGCRYLNKGSSIPQSEAFCCRTWPTSNLRGSVEIGKSFVAVSCTLTCSLLVTRATYCLQNDYITRTLSQYMIQLGARSVPYCLFQSYLSLVKCLGCFSLYCPTQCFMYDTRQIQHPPLVVVSHFVLLARIYSLVL